jgi:septal ring factor EnvC (AmiA/AmiB activator)
MATALASRDELEKTLLQTQQELDAAHSQVEGQQKGTELVKAQLQAAEARYQAAEARVHDAQAGAAAASDRVLALEGQMEALQVSQSHTTVT